MRKLRDITREVCRQKKIRQEDLAALLEMNPTTLSKLGTGWEEHWRVTLALLPILDELGIDPYAGDPPGDLTEEIKSRIARRLAEVTEREPKGSRDSQHAKTIETGTGPRGSELVSRIVSTRRVPKRRK